VLEQEHRILPQAVRWFLEGRLQIECSRVRVEGVGREPAALICPEVA
jgi:phosphoribosylglycinamide formyltransferase-1